MHALHFYKPYNLAGIDSKIARGFKLLGSVVQRWVSANPGLKFNLLFWFVYFYMSVYFKTSEK